MSENQSIPLTDRQHQVLSFIAARAKAPTQTEIGAAFGITRSNVCNIVSRMEAAGYVSRVAGKIRNLRIVRSAPPRRALTREEGLEFARAWRIRMKPHFDAIYGPEA